MISSVDIGNPIYKSVPEPKFTIDTMTDYILDEEQDSHVVKIEYKGYLYDGALRLTKLTVTTKCPDKYLREDVVEMIRQRENEHIVLECEMEHINKQP